MAKKNMLEIESIGTEELTMTPREAKEFGISIRSEDIGFDYDDPNDPYNE